MSSFQSIPRLPLAAHVDFLWCAAGYSRPHSAERVLPTGCMDLVINLDDAGSASQDSFSGARTRSFVLDTARALNVIGVRFKAGGGSAFLDMPAGELQDLVAAPADVWGREGGVLRERLLEVHGVEERFRAIEQFLLARMRRSRRRSFPARWHSVEGGHPAVRFAVRAFQQPARGPGDDAGDCAPPSVGAVTDHVGLSSRRFIEVFRNEVGMTPKVFSRLMRFRGVVSAVADSASVDWTQVAQSCGYFDQAHLIHDFGEFAGVSPSVWLRLRTERINHIRASD